MRLRREDEAGETLGILIFGIVMFGLVSLLIGIIIVPEKLYYLAGILAGNVASVFAVINMYDVLNISLGMGENAKGFVKIRSMLRMAVAVAILIVSIIVNPYMFAGAAIGLFGIKVSGFFHKPIKKMVFAICGREYVDDIIPDQSSEGEFDIDNASGSKTEAVSEDKAEAAEKTADSDDDGDDDWEYNPVTKTVYGRHK